MKDLNELNTEIELIKKDIYDIKNNHLSHIEKDMRDVKIEVFRFKYIAYGAIVIFVLATDKFTKGKKQEQVEVKKTLQYQIKHMQI